MAAEVGWQKTLRDLVAVSRTNKWIGPLQRLPLGRPLFFLSAYANDMQIWWEYFFLKSTKKSEKIIKKL